MNPSTHDNKVIQDLMETFDRLGLFKEVRKKLNDGELTDKDLVLLIAELDRRLREET